MGKSGGKGISYFGLVAMGIGCMLGTSWLLLTGTWLETAGGPLNLVVAFALCIIIELPFAFAYMEAIPMLPLPGGEVVYSYAAFGSRGGFAVGWAGILMNTIVFCWVDLAAVSLLDELFPVLGRTAVLYELGDFPVTLPNVAIQLALAGAILWVQLRGANVCASLAKLATVERLVMATVGLATLPARPPFCPCWCSPWPGGRRCPRLPPTPLAPPPARRGPPSSPACSW